jgi:pimeloyl-ACP methyl ester carboxylesterase
MPNWNDRDAVADYIVGGQRLLAGSYGFDELRAHRLAAKIVARTRNPASSLINHWIMRPGGMPDRSRLGEITKPAFVIHGTEDPLFPIGHGQALVRELPQAQLLELDRVGHEMPPAHTWDFLTSTLITRTVQCEL